MPNNLSNPVDNFDFLWIEHGYGNRFQGFQNLMRLRMRDILIVASLYDLYLFEEDGKLYEMIRNEYQLLNLSHSPEIARVSSGREAISLLQEENRFDLIITTLYVEDMHALELAKLIKENNYNIPIVLLAYDNRELKDLLLRHDTSVFTKIFIWQGDFRLIIAIIKLLEDILNVDHDTRVVGTQNLIVIEDDIRFYSYFLPVVYTEILKQSQRLIHEGINLSHRFLRMRARPKILLCSTYEEAWEYYTKYKEFILGIISDIDYKYKGVQNPLAGIKFVEAIRKGNDDIPVLLQSNVQQNEEMVQFVGAKFIYKDSPTFLSELHQFMINYFSFGDFIFRTPEGFEVGRASNLIQLEEQLRVVPESSVKFHAERNHFSNWLKARTEFWLAHKLRPRKVTDFPSVAGLRNDLINSMHTYRMMRQRDLIAEFSKETYNPETSIARIGSGSLGGKARGLGFVNTLINDYNIRDRFDDVLIYVPPAAVLGTEVFDRFIIDNDLRSFALNCNDDKEITKRFLEASKFPEDVLAELAAFLDIVRTPLAVRSSSLLEDSQYHPFAGVYETYMIPNKHANPLIRLNDLLNAIKRVFASTFYQGAKDYFKVTSYRLEEEKMAVIIQKLVGSLHENRFYPDFAGVAKSYNFYPVGEQKSNDGIVSAALGLGKTVVEGGNSVKFCPKYPTDLMQFDTIKDSLDNNQLEFYALDLEGFSNSFDETHDVQVKQYGLNVAEVDGTLNYVGSIYSKENDAIYDGLSRIGQRIVTFSPILKNKIFPLSQIIELLLDMGTWGMGKPVEIEFAVKLSTFKGQPKEFALLQMRPLVISREGEALSVEEKDRKKLICRSSQILGNGAIEDIKDIVVVDYNKFIRAQSRKVANEIAKFNTRLISETRPYLLIGIGRWGSRDPWLGIPVKWEEIVGARAIVESTFKDFSVTLSQGSHFFQNITSFQVGYFTICDKDEDCFIDWDWLLSRKPYDKMEYTRLLRFENPIIVKMNGQQRKGIILKPEDEK
jgi:CheY-like chemotaxis protein